MSNEPRVVFRGVSMIASWPAQIDAAQRQRTYRLGDFDLPRVAYGEESIDWNAAAGPCHDCQVIKGELHVPGCDVEQCPHCGEQLLSVCACPWPGSEEE